MKRVELGGGWIICVLGLGSANVGFKGFGFEK